MIQQPDNVPNTPMLRWVSWIRLFDLKTKHIPALSFKMEDTLSRAPPIDTGHADPAHNTKQFLDAFKAFPITHNGRYDGFVTCKSICTSAVRVHIHGFWTLEFDGITYTAVPNDDDHNLTLLPAMVGHQFGTQDQDNGLYRLELRLFLSNGKFPDCLLTNTDHLAFQCRT
ncbi:hypothetical protein C8Q80DRAFT_1275392 [Daedaleopsis nitida]|nr:hypothetical protein C8Q80DRAFT_1275392 [Daedaleopsis nitida]